MPKRSYKAKQLGSLDRAKNNFRGVFSQRRRRGFLEEDTARNRVFRTNLRKALLDARLLVNPEDYDELISWLRGMMKQELGQDHDLNFGYDYLNGVIVSPRATLEREILWVSSRIQSEAAQINEFTSFLQSIEGSILQNDPREAVEKLEVFCEKYGQTMWSVQLGIATRHRLGGLEDQKAFLEEIRAKHRRGILSYVAFHTSIRNEERTSWARFRGNVYEASRKRKDKPLGRYIAYRLLSILPETQSGVADILRIEQCNSIFDLYETFIFVAQNILSDPASSDLPDLIQHELTKMAKIDDFRIRKLLDHPSEDSLKHVHQHIEDGNFAGAYKALNRLPKGDRDPWSMLYKSALRSNKELGPNPNVLQEAIHSALYNGVLKANNFDNLAKVCQNYRYLPIGRGLLTFVEGILSSDGMPKLRFDSVGLNSPNSSLEDNLGLRRIFSTLGTYDSRYRYAAGAVNSYLCKKYEEVNNLLAIIPPLNDNITRSLLDLIHVRSLDATSDLPTLVPLISRLGSSDTSLLSLATLSQLVESYQSDDFKRLQPSIETLNALHMLWKSGDRDHLGSTLKMITGRYLRSTEEKAPSSMKAERQNCSMDEFVYFLREVCVPNVLDVSRVFKSSRAVSEERQKICGLLHSLDPDKSIEYSEEVSGIARRLKVDEGLQIVDQSRIYVDTDALTRWAYKNVYEDYGRYSDLVSAGVGISGKYDETLKELRDIVAKSRSGELITPENEADNILASILTKLRDEFLSSSTFGLDYFLSQRIRHISFVGLVRGPLEFQKLISNRPTPQSEYSSNRYWLEKFETLSRPDLDELDNDFKTFSAEFDYSLSQVKDVYLQVRSPDKPDGLFAVPVSATLLMLARALYSQASSFADFVDSVCVIFWAVLDEPLKAVQYRIEVTLKDDLAVHFGNLRVSLRRFDDRAVEFPKAAETLALCERQVNEALREAAAWFTRPELREVKKTFTLEEALDVAIESARKLHANFEPNISVEVSENIYLRGPDLVFITDAILVAFSNIKAYSRLDQPSIGVTLLVDVETGSLSIEVINDCAPNSRIPSQDRKMAVISEAIAKRDFGKKPRMEGGTGFLKLAAVAYQSDRGLVDFGYMDKTHFRMQVNYSFIMDAVEMAV